MAQSLPGSVFRPRFPILGWCLLVALAFVSGNTWAAPKYDTIRAFERPPTIPRNTLCLGSDGYFYGTMAVGGPYEAGSLFKIDPSSGISTTVINFTGRGTNNRGASPWGDLVSDGAGFIWGTTMSGGTDNNGTVFKLNLSTGQLITVVEFTYTDGPNRGSTPLGGLVNDGAGNFWGTTSNGGTYNNGTLFKVNSSTGAFTTLIDFNANGPTNRGSNPQGNLVTDGAGFIWGTTSSGGTSYNGTIYKVNINTGVLTTKADLNVNSGSYPQGGLANDGAGNLWGTTSQGGTSVSGTIFKVNINTGALTTVLNFTGGGGSNPGWSPRGSLTRDGAGNFWGTTAMGGTNNFGTVFKVSIGGGALSTIANFTDSVPGNLGNAALSGLASDGNGNFWGTTSAGGSNGCGTVFKVNTSSGALTTVVDIKRESDEIRGRSLFGSVVNDGTGYFWGTTREGGNSDLGTIFKVDTSSGALTTMVDFGGFIPSRRGSRPEAGLVPDGNGFLWGTTSIGGSGSYGTVYKVNINTGALTTVVDFLNQNAAAPGGYPHGELFNDGAGFLWGTTEVGGAHSNGTIFKVNISTGAMTVVFHFDYVNGGSTGPISGLASDGAGFLWGTTPSGGTMGVGTVYKVDQTNGTLTKVVDFKYNGGEDRGGSCYAGLVNDGTGYFWGCTSQGGTFGRGTLFKVNIATGAITTVLDFDPAGTTNRGAYPHATLVKDAAGYLWGATPSGGANSFGTLYRVNPATGASRTMVDFTNCSGAAPGFAPQEGHLYLHSDGKLYGVTLGGGVNLAGLPAGGGQIFRLTPDDATEPPILTSPATGSSFNDAFTVSYDFPEVATAGAQLVFDNGEGTVRALNLASARLDSGPHSFSIDPNNLAANTSDISSVTGGNTLPEGTYTVTLTYADTYGNEPASATATGVRFDVTPPDTQITGKPGVVSNDPAPTFTFSGMDGALVLSTFEVNLDGAGFAAEASPYTPTGLGSGSHTIAVRAVDAAGNVAPTPASYTWVIDTTKPTVSAAPVVIEAGPNGFATLNDQRSLITASDNLTATANLTIEQLTDPATVLPLGTHAVAFTVTDEAQNVADAQALVTVAFAPSGPAGDITEMIHTGTPAPGAGTGDIPQGAMLSSFGTPALSDYRAMAARATLASGKSKLAAIYQIDGAGAANIPAIQNGPVPGANGQAQDGLSFKSFLDPVISPSGSIAFAATVKGAKTTSDQGVWTNAFGPLAQVLREGSVVPGLPAGVKLKSVTSLSLRDGDLLALVKLAPARGLVTAGKDDTALISLSDVNTAMLLLRTGPAITTPVATPGIKTIATLAPALGSPGQGRWHGEGVVLAKVTLTTGEVQIITITAPALIAPVITTAGAAGVIDPAARWKNFGVPAMGCDGYDFTLAATLVPTPGIVSSKDDVVLLYSSDGSDWEVYAREGGLTPISDPADGPRYVSFFDPIANEAGQVAFLATLKGGDVKGANKTGIFCGTTDQLRLVARLGTFAPDQNGQPNGGTWSKFTSYALPSGPGAGLVLLGEATGSDLPKFKQALWAIDSSDTLRRVLRTGVPLVTNGPVIKTLALLAATPGSTGVERSYNETASAAVLVTFDDKSQALLRVDLP